MEKPQSTILDCFPKLIQGNDKERIDSGIALIKYLSDKNWDDTTSKELNLALRRLIGGTGSHHINARKSFYVTLTAYLIAKPETPAEKILEIMEKKLEPLNNNHKGENGEIFTGRILTCGSLIRSKILEKSSPEVQKKVLEHLISAGNKRSYLPYVAYSFIIDFLNQINKKTFSVNVWPYLKTELVKPWSEQNLETLHTLIFIQDKFPSVVKETYKQNFGGENIINEDSLESITKILTDIPRIVCFRHPVYKLFIEKLCETEYVPTFWSAIDQRFVKPSKSDEYLATEILRLLLQSVSDKSVIPDLLSEKYLQYMLRKCKFNRRNKRDEVTHAFINVLTLLPTIMSEITEEKVKISTLKRLMLYPGDLMIEKWTGTRIIQLITASLKTEGVKKLSKVYKEIMENPQVKEKQNDHRELWTNAERIYTAQLLTKLLSHTEVTSDHVWRLKQLKFLFKSGLCESPNIGGDLASQIKVSFYRALDNKLPKLSDLRSMLNDLVTYLDEILFTNNDMKLRTPLEEAATEAWKKMISLVKQLEESHDNIAAFFHTMDLHMGLQLFTDPEMAISSIDELHNCFERLKKKSKKTKRESNEDEPEWTEVIVDLILSLLSRNEHLLRTVIGCVFPHICPHLTSASLHQILAVLDVKNTKGPLSIKGTENDDDDSSAESDAESENEKNGIDDSESEGEETQEDEQDSESENDSEPEEEVEEDETVTDRLRLAVSQALGGAPVQTDDEDMDVDEIDEEEGKRLDENLAAAFKMFKENRRTQSKKQAKPAEFLTHFRIRVIDLIEDYLDSCPPMALALDMVVPLFMLLEFCIKEPHQKPLENKVKACLKKLSSVKKFKNTEGVDGELLTTLMKVLIEKGERSASVCQEMGDQLAKCCMFLVRCSQQANLPKEDLALIYKEHLTAFFKKRDCILWSLFFKNILQLFWQGNWILVPLLVDFAFDKEIRSFRRSQALELLLVFYRNARLLKDEEHQDTRLKLEKKLCKNSIKLLNELSAVQSKNGDANPKDEHEVGKEIRQKFVRHLFALLYAVRPHHLPPAWNWQKISEAMAIYRPNASLSKDDKAAYNKLATQIGAPINSAFKKNEVKKEKTTNGLQSENGAVEALDADEVTDQDEEKDSPKTKKKKKKKKKNSGNQKEKQKLKKEARKLRAEAMSQGLKSFDFSTVVLPNRTDEHENVENGREETEKVKSSQHKRNSQDTPNRPNKKKKTSQSET